MISKFISSFAGQLLLALLGLAIVSACSMRPAAKTTPHNELVDSHWQLKKIADYTHELDAKRLPTMHFTADRMNGSNGCNQMFGNYTLGGDGSITFGQLGSTRKLCMGNAGNLENAVNKALANSHLYALSRTELNLMDKQRKLLMVFTPAQP